VLKRLFVRNGQFLSSLLSAGSEHPAAVGRGHSFAETVLILSFSAGGLIRALHNYLIWAFLSKGLQICGLFRVCASAGGRLANRSSVRG